MADEKKQEGTVSNPESAASSGDVQKRQKLARPFPKHTLREALVIANAIHDKNADKPFDRLSVAEAVGRKPSSSEFEALISSSSRYGLTIGTEKSRSISLAPTGRSIVSPVDPTEKAAGLVKAALTPDTLARITRNYDNGRLPDTQFVVSTLVRNFGLEQARAQECARIAIDNAALAGLSRESQGSTYISIPNGLQPGSQLPEGEEEDLPDAPATMNAVQKPMSGVLPTAIPSLNINLQIHLPSDASPDVYEVIFQNIRDYLMTVK